MNNQHLLYNYKAVKQYLTALKLKIQRNQHY